MCMIYATHSVIIASSTYNRKDSNRFGHGNSSSFSTVGNCRTFLAEIVRRRLAGRHIVGYYLLTHTETLLAFD